MADDLIVQLYPINDENHQHYAEQVIMRHPQGILPDAPEEDIFAGRGSREPTVSREATPQVSGSRLEDLACLALHFSRGPQTTSGFVFGIDKQCDVVLPTTKTLGLSRRHFALTYKHFADGFPRLIIRDLGSRRGISVTYNNEGAEVRRNFDWVLHGFRFPDQAKFQLVVKLHDDLQFQIVVANQDITSAEYLQNVAQFLGGQASAGDLLGGLGIQSGLVTMLDTGAQTPTQRQQPIQILVGNVGRGPSASVTRHWDVSTGKEFVRKTPVGPNTTHSDWQGIGAVMGKVTHVSNPLYPERRDELVKVY